MAFSICKIKNNLSTDITVADVILSPGEIYIIPDTKRLALASSDDLLSQIVVGSIQIGDGDQWLSGISIQIDRLKEY